MKPEAYSIEAASKTLSLSQPTIWRMIRRGELASVKIGGRRIIPASAIAKLLSGAA